MSVKHYIFLQSGVSKKHETEGSEQMYINPIVVGVVGTLLVEVVAVIIAVAIFNRKDK